MRVLKRKELQTLSLVAPDRPQTIQPIIFPTSTTKAIRPSETELVKRPRISTAEIKRRLLQLTSLDVMRVNRATIREGESHCIWPPDIIERFRTADVVTDKGVSHYVVREGTLTRVK